MQYSKSENFKYLVIEASFGDYYGFNTKVKKEREIATKIVSEFDDFMVKGWKVAKKLPGWVLSAHYFVLTNDKYNRLFPFWNFSPNTLGFLPKL